MASLEQVELVETTVAAIDAALEDDGHDDDSSQMPQLWEEVWKPVAAPQVSPPPPPPGDGEGGLLLWIVYKAEVPLVARLISELKGLGRLVVEVDSGSHFQERRNQQQPSLWGYSVNPNEKSHFEQLARSVSSRKEGGSASVVEGVLYSWPLDHSKTAQADLLQPFLYIAQTLSLLVHDNNYGVGGGGGGGSRLPRVVALTSGISPPAIGENEGEPAAVVPHSSGICGFSKAWKNENFNELNVKCIDVPGAGEEVADEQVYQALLRQEIWRDDDGEVEVALVGNQRLTPKLVSITQAHKRGVVLPLPPASPNFYLKLPATNAISDLRYEALPPPVDAARPLRDNEIGVRVKAIGLNFRDYLSIVKPSEQFKDATYVGFEFSGVVEQVGGAAAEEVTRWKVGDLVFGVSTRAQEFPFSNYVQVPEGVVAEIPPDWTFNDAATIPEALITAHHGLVEAAQLKPGETALIHTASGGVGLAALQLCRAIIGAEGVIATAGSRRKRAFLRSLGVRHVFNSRNPQFGDAILEVTHGTGVDVVLNSLTGPGFKEASLAATRRGGRFVEMSKLSVWSAAEVQALRPDVKYTVIDTAKFSEEEWALQMGRVGKYIKTGQGGLNSSSISISPLPVTRFDASSIKEALEYLQSAKHIGKVVSVMPPRHQLLPEQKSDGSHEGHHHRSSPLFNENSTYLLTGGLGGIGLEVAKWMVACGAKHLLLAGRNRPKPEAERLLQQLRADEGGALQLIPVQLDVGDYEQLKTVVGKVRYELSLPPLRGVMHLAGQLADDLVDAQNWKRSFEPILNAKIQGTLNLHALTTEREEGGGGGGPVLPLEHFVLFSSVASSFGTPGQSNYAAGNHFEDSFAHYRHSIGLPATVVNWGLWGQVGMGTGYELPGMRPLSTVQALRALEYVMRSSPAARVQTCIMNMDSFTTFSQRTPSTRAYVAENIWKWEVEARRRLNNNSAFHAGADRSSVNNKPQQQETSSIWELLDSRTATMEEKTQELKARVKSVLRLTLRMDEAEEIGDHSSFQELGVDSLRLIEIRNGLQGILGDGRVTLSGSTLRDHETVHLVSSKLMEIIAQGNVEDDDDEGRSMMEYAKTFIRKESSNLPERIRPVGLLPATPVPEIKTILLTGLAGGGGGDSLIPHMLLELCRNPQIVKVYCLLRPKKGKGMEETLASILENGLMLQSSAKQQLMAGIILPKVACIGGELAPPQFGMKAGQWDKLTSEVDAIFHCGAVVDHVINLNPNNPSFTKSITEANIGGVVTALEFASTRKLKHVFYASSFINLVRYDEVSGGASEDWPEVGDYDDFTTQAYPITRFVAELLMKQGAQRGIPVKAFRFPTMGGHSESGRVAIEQNHQYLLYLQILKLGLVPSIPFPVVVLPVDKVAQVSTAIFFHPEAPASGVFNVVHPEPIPLLEFSSVAARLGYPVQSVAHGEFAKAVVQEGKTGEPTPFQVFKEAYEDIENRLFALQYSRLEIVQKWLLLWSGRGGDDEKADGNFWKSQKIASLLPEFYSGLEPVQATLEKELQFCKEQGWFQKFKLD